MNVVTIGPVDMAGSIFSFSNRMGKTDPTKQAIIIELKIEVPTTIPNLNGD